MQGQQDKNSKVKKLQSIGQVLQTEYNLSQAQYASQNLKRQSSIKRKQSQLNKKYQLISKINKAITSILEKRAIINKKVNQDTEGLQKLEKLSVQSREAMSQQKYYYKIPVINFDLRQIQTPQSISLLNEKLQQEFQYEKGIYQNDITKIKIMIKLAQINLEDAQSQVDKQKRTKS